MGMGDQQRQRYQVQLSLRQKYQQQLEQLRRDSERKGTYNTDDYRKAEQALTESLNRQLSENRRYWQQLEIAQGDWKTESCVHSRMSLRMRITQPGQWNSCSRLRSVA